MSQAAENISILIDKHHAIQIHHIEIYNTTMWMEKHHTIRMDNHHTIRMDNHYIIRMDNHHTIRLNKHNTIQIYHRDKNIK